MELSVRPTQDERRGVCPVHPVGRLQRGQNASNPIWNLSSQLLRDGNRRIQHESLQGLVGTAGKRDAIKLRKLWIVHVKTAGKIEVQEIPLIVDVEPTGLDDGGAASQVVKELALVLHRSANTKNID